MIPRLTIYGRQHDTNNRTKCGYSYFSSRPSPAERLRQRRKARAAAMRSLDKPARMKRDEWECESCYDEGCRQTCINGKWITEPCPACSLPQSRGTTTGQLVAMHLEAEE